MPKDALPNDDRTVLDDENVIIVPRNESERHQQDVAARMLAKEFLEAYQKWWAWNRDQKKVVMPPTILPHALRMLVFAVFQTSGFTPDKSAEMSHDLAEFLAKAWSNPKAFADLIEVGHMTMEEVEAMARRSTH